MIWNVHFKIALNFVIFLEIARNRLAVLKARQATRTSRL